MVTCWVVPGASRSEIKGTYGETLRIRVAAPPEGGKANREAGRLLSATLGGEGELLSGAASREKRFLLRGIDRRQAEGAISG